MLKLRKLQAVFYRSAAGREPVREWLEDLSRDDRRILGKDIAGVQFRWPLGKPKVDHLRGGIWEVRSNLDNRIARVLFAVARSDEGEQMVLLHGFIKKTRVTPAEELGLAETRWKTWQGEQQGGHDE